MLNIIGRQTVVYSRNVSTLLSGIGNGPNTSCCGKIERLKNVRTPLCENAKTFNIQAQYFERSRIDMMPAQARSLRSARTATSSVSITHSDPRRHQPSNPLVRVARFELWIGVVAAVTP